MSAVRAGTRLAVLGSPISHSRSPALHAAAYSVLGLDWGFDRIEVESGRLRAFFADLDESWLGFAVTMPLKREVMALVDDVDPVARRAGAVNTVHITGGGVRGFNTDVYGVRMALGELDVTAPRVATVLGAGATAASVIVALAELGTERVRVVARSPERAAAAVSLAVGLGLGAEVAGFAEPIPEPQDVVISTLPGGVSLSKADVAALAPAATRALVPLLDISYGSHSELSQAWTAASGRSVSGLSMLLHQAVQQVRIFVTGSPAAPLPDEVAVVAAMRESIAH